MSTEPDFITASGHFANGRYRHVRMPDHLEVDDPKVRAALYHNESIRVYNARQLIPPPTVDVQGFQLVVKQETKVTEFLDMDTAIREFYPECVDIVKQVTGCSDTYVTQHQYRNGYSNYPEGHPRRMRPTPNGSPGGYGGTHSDISPMAENRWDDIVDGRHCAMFNLWRSIDLEHDIETMPLALLDMTSLDFDDMVAADAWGGPQRVQQHLVSYRLAYNPNQRWYYFPRMRPDELLIFKQYDTRQTDPSMRQVYHGAVVDPQTSEDSPLRQTIEVRVLALFGREKDRNKRKAIYQSEIPDQFRGRDHFSLGNAISKRALLKHLSI